MIVTEAEQAELHRAILAYWATLQMPGEPSPDWKRRMYRLLFGCPFQAPEDALQDAPLPFWDRLLAAKEACWLLTFHVDRLSANNPIAALLFARMRVISEQAIELHFAMQRKQEEADDAQAA